jgi:4-hydroxy-tetrahydrodipicolinate synthase
MKNISLAGSIVAIPTPFKDGQVDESGLRKIVEFHLANGTNGIVPCGTTGESATLTHTEHERVIATVVEAAAGRIKIIAGTGSNNTAEAVSLTRMAVGVGADGALLISPYYNRPTQNGLYEHFKAVSESVDMPLVLYSIQSRTGVNIEPETVARLAELGNIIGIKEASGNLVQMMEIKRLTGSRFQLTAGDDALLLPVLSIGGVGVISVLANIAPKWVTGLIKLFRENRLPEAIALNNLKHIPLIKLLFMETNPVPVKTAMQMLGLIDRAEIRRPLCALSSGNAALLEKEIAAVRSALNVYAV